MTCPKCIAPKLSSKPCNQYVGFHSFCHGINCGFTWSMHRGAARIRQPDSDRVRPTLTVIDGGDAPVELDAEARMWSAWVDGEDNR